MTTEVTYQIELSCSDQIDYYSIGLAVSGQKPAGLSYIISLIGSRAGEILRQYKMSKHAYAVLQMLNAKGVAMVTSKTLMHEYYEKVIDFPHRPLLEWAATLNQSSTLTAIDCGCGTGSDSAYLAQLGYKVHCFDINAKSIEICRKRLSTQPNISVLESSFESFRYPKAGLVVAHASLFFCDPSLLTDTWKKISNSIQSGGVFCGDFMGLNDSWADNSNHTITALSETKIRSLLEGFEIRKFSERNEAGKTALGKSKIREPANKSHTPLAFKEIGGPDISLHYLSRISMPFGYWPFYRPQRKY